MIVKNEDYVMRMSDELEDLLRQNNGNRVETIVNLKRYVNEPENKITPKEYAEKMSDKKFPLAYNYMKWDERIHAINSVVKQRIRSIYGNKSVGLKELWDVYHDEFLKKYNYMDETSIQLMWQQSKVPLLFCYNFETTKQIYDFDSECFEFLSKNTDVKKIPYQVLRDNLPMNAFAINNSFACGELKIRQTIVAKIPTADGMWELGVFFIGEAPEYDYVNMFFPLDVENGKGYEQNIEDRIRNEIGEYNEEIIEAVYKIIPCIVYLCAQNREVRPLKERNGLERNRDKYRSKEGVKCEEVGYYIGTTIKKNRVQYASSGSFTGTGSSKRPHIRSGHFHHYWTGEGRTELTVKFVESTFVHGGTTNRAVVHKVKK